MEQTVSSTIPVLKTPFQVEKEARELEIFNEYNELMSVAGQSATAVTEHLMQKHSIHSASTIYEIRKRVSARIANAQEGAAL